MSHMAKQAVRCAWCAVEHHRLWKREWHSRNSAKVAERSRGYRAANGDVLKSRNLKRMYGITLAQFDDMYDAQHGQCMSCGNSKPRRGRDGLVTDHCHKSGAIRGLLCTTCNKLEGFLDKHAEQYRAVLGYHSKYCQAKTS